MRKPLEKTFKKNVEGVGSFIFQHLTLREELQVENLVAKLLDYNNEPTEGSLITARMMASLEIATVQAPKGWSTEDIYDFEDLAKVFDAYIEEVQFFRNKGKREGEEEGPRESQDSKILVSTAIQTPGKRSKVS